MAFVIDASTVLCWALEDETHPVATEALLRLDQEHAWVPALWWFEVRNALLMNERRGKITTAAVDGFLRELANLPIMIDRSPAEERLMDLARRHKLTVYDAAYLELADRLNEPLATLDRQLARATLAEHLTLLG